MRLSLLEHPETCAPLFTSVLFLAVLGFPLTAVAIRAWSVYRLLRKFRRLSNDLVVLVRCQQMLAEFVFARNLKISQ